MSTGALAQNAPSYKFKKPVAQLPVQTSSGGPSNPDSGGGTPPVLTGQLEVSTNALNFGAVEVGNSSSLSFLVGNFGQAALSLNPVTYLGLGYTADSLCGSSLNVAQDCQVSVSFSPTARGAFNGSATVTSSAGSKTVTFTGQGVQASGSLQPGTSADFGSVVVGQSADRVFLFSNTGDAPARNTQVQAVSAPLSIVSNSCGNVVSPVTLNPGQNCSVSLRYQPTAPTALSSSLTVVSSAENSPVSLNLVGQALQGILLLAPTDETIDFGFIAQGQLETRSFTLSNTGNAPISNINIAVSSHPDIAITQNNCGTSLAASNSCEFSITYQPSEPSQLENASLTLSYEGALSPIVKSMEGGVAYRQAAVSPVSQAGFGNVAIGSVSNRTFTISNSGTLPLQEVYPVYPSHPNLTLLSSTCGQSASNFVVLEAGNSCSFTLSYAPSSTTGFSGNIYFSTASTLISPPNTIATSGTASIPADPFYSSVFRIYKFDGALGSTSYSESKSGTPTLTSTTSVASLSTSSPKFGSASLRFNSDNTSSGGVSMGGFAPGGSIDGSFTIEFFYKPSAKSGLQGPGSLHAEGLMFGWRTSNEFGVARNNGSGWSLYGNSSTSPVVGQWSHIAFQINASTGFASLYINGIRVGHSNSSGMSSGGYYTSRAYSIFGSNGAEIDDIRITRAVRYDGASFVVPAYSAPTY